MKRMFLVVVVAASLFIAGQVQGQNLTCTGTVFNDVNSVTQPTFCGWIEWFSDLGITSGCSANPPRYCPNDFVTRAQMAVFVSKAMRGGHDNSVTFDTDTVGGGGSNTASGDYSFAAGRRANANAAGCFVWGDSTDALVSCGGTLIVGLPVPAVEFSSTATLRRQQGCGC